MPVSVNYPCGCPSRTREICFPIDFDLSKLIRVRYGGMLWNVDLSICTMIYTPRPLSNTNWSCTPEWRQKKSIITPHGVRLLSPPPVALLDLEMSPSQKIHFRGPLYEKQGSCKRLLTEQTSVNDKYVIHWYPLKGKTERDSWDHQEPVRSLPPFGDLIVNVLEAQSIFYLGMWACGFQMWLPRRIQHKHKL